MARSSYSFNFSTSASANPDFSQDPTFTQSSQTSIFLDDLRRQELHYTEEVSTLKSRLRSLSHRTRAAQKVLRTSPIIDFPELELVAQLESQVESAEQILDRQDLSALTQETQDNLEYAERLERSNADRRLHRPRFDSSLTDSHRVKFRRLPPVPDGESSSPLSVASVKRQIARLIESVKSRELEYQQTKREIKAKYAENLRIRARIENDLKLKEDHIDKLRKKLLENERLASEIDAYRQKISEFQGQLPELQRRRERLERENFTAGRDRHNNSEAVRRLRELKTSYESRLETFHQQQETLRLRRIAYEKREIDVVARAEVVNRFEGTVLALEQELADKGVKFSGTLTESQRELWTLDQLASQRTVGRKDHSFEQERSMVLREGQSESDDVFAEWEQS
jgi:chromosome segregation ATPase